MAHWNSVRLASTGNIDLRDRSIGKFVDGIAVAEGYRILLKDQTRPSENGIYRVSRRIFPRRLYLERDSILENQMIVRIVDGAVNANTTWRLAHLSSSFFVPQKWDSDWKAHVRVATTGNVDLNEMTVDSVHLEIGDRILVRSQIVERENGIYIVPASGGRWQRAEDMRVRDD